MTERATTKTVYTSCLMNCGSNGNCVLKAHVRQGVVVAVEPDDRYNKNVGREDEVLSDKELMAARLQRRACAKGIAFHKYLNHPDRILYPLKRDPKSKRGEGKYIRIGWEEAIDTVATKVREVVARHGPHSLLIPFSYTPGSQGWVRIFSFLRAGVQGWGWSSWDSNRLTAQVMTGVSGWDYPHYGGSSASDMLAHSKVIVIWGLDPTMGSSGPGYQFSYYLKLARERGAKVIILDPRYTIGAQVLADQWIPIKPGTDLAMYLSMANVLFKENLWDRNFVDNHVESKGFGKWKDHVLGIDDGIDKTPEWAEKICAVPAETIRELTRLVATTRPSWLWSNWGVNRKSHGEDTAKGFAALQATLGYWGIPGAGPAIHLGPQRALPPAPPWGPPGEYNTPLMYRCHYWAQAVLLLKKVRSGELSEAEYMRMVGWKADPALVKSFDPKIALFNRGFFPHSSDFLVTATDAVRDQIEALESMEFTVGMHSMLTSTMKYADILLPVQDPAWEQMDFEWTNNAYGGFQAINFCPGVLDPPGEAKHWIWIYIKIAEKLGIPGNQYFSWYTGDKNWNDDWERYLKTHYEGIRNYYAMRNITVPIWEDFIQGNFINCDELEGTPAIGWDDQVREGKPFQTGSGKIEVYSEYIGKKENKGRGEHIDDLGRPFELLPSDWGDYSPMPMYKPPVRGMDDPAVHTYPLMLLSPHCRYRVHYLLFNHPWLRGHVYRHRIWVSAADAKTRGIRDDDLVLVHNEQGKVLLPAYVTGRVMPGVVLIHHGGWYQPDASGLDRGGSPSTLLGGDFTSNTTAAKTTTLVQIEKYQGGN